MVLKHGSNTIRFKADISKLQCHYPFFFFLPRQKNPKQSSDNENLQTFILLITLKSVLQVKKITKLNITNGEGRIPIHNVIFYLSIFFLKSFHA